MTKKIISLLLAVVVCVGLCTVIASAAGTTHEVTTEAELATALTNAVDGDTISLKNDITWTSTGKAVIKANVTIEGNGKTLTFNNSKFGLRVEDATVTEVTIQNLTIVNTAKDGRCINIYADGVESVTIDNCVLDASNATGHPQPITMGGSEADGYTTPVYVTDSEIKTSTSGYGIISYLTVDLYVEGCTFEGWNALYLKPGSDNSYVQVSDSVIDTVNVHSGTTNAFAAILIESDNNVLDIYTTKITGKSEGDQPQSAIGLGSEVAKNVNYNEITIQPGCEVEADNLVQVQESDNISDNDFLAPAEYAEELVENGYVVIIEGDYVRPAITQEFFDTICPDHKLTVVKSEKPACAKDGFVTYYVCNEDCCGGLVFSDEEGRICVADDVDEYEPISAEHTYKRVEKVEATLEATGMEEHLECEVCGGFFKLTGEPVEENSLVIEKLTSEEETEEKTEEKTEIKNPPTNDDTILAFTVLALVSAATVIVVARKKVNN